MKIGALKVDSARGEQGDWISDMPGMGNLRLKVRGFGNKDYGALVSRLTAAVTREDREGGRIAGPPRPAVRDGIISRAMAETILLDWEGLEDEAGQSLPYSKAKAVELLSEPDFRPFREAVAYAAGVVEEVAADQVGAVVPN